MLSIVGDVIHEAPLAMVERVSFLQLFCCLDVNQISSIFHNKIALVERFHSLRKISVQNRYKTKSIKLSTHLDAATLVLDGSNLDPMFRIIRDREAGADGLQLRLDDLGLGLPLAAADGEVLRDLVAGGGRGLQLPRLRAGGRLLGAGGRGGDGGGLSGQRVRVSD